ncbi:MAG: hypothetical protein KKA55_13110 [Proteobacteria bacterium]|nr:hypothetical protein [Pseudomonadota bacterium]MBU1596458.1 hypothetical protein [Pseudomonadota bacterium]
MPNLHVLPLFATLAAPAFFLFFALASLGSPLLAVICLCVGRMRGTQHPEAYARRLLRMALACTLPACALLFSATGLTLYRTPWFRNWLFAAPLVPALLAAAISAYGVSLLLWRASRISYRSRPDSPLAQAGALALLAVVILWLALSWLRDLTAQALAVLDATISGGGALVPLLRPDLSSTAPWLWAAVLAGALASAMCAGAWSLEYLMLRRDREPFGREAFAHTMRLAARASLRSGLLALSFLPALWEHLTHPPGSPSNALLVQALLMGCGSAIVLACIAWIVLARSSRPCSHPVLVHGSLALVWTGLTAALCAALVRFYAA